MSKKNTEKLEAIEKALGLKWYSYDFSGHRIIGKYYLHNIDNRGDGILNDLLNKLNALIEYLGLTAEYQEGYIFKEKNKE